MHHLLYPVWHVCHELETQMTLNTTNSSSVLAAFVRHVHRPSRIEHSVMLVERHLCLPMRSVMQVQRPTELQRRATKMASGQVFVMYFGTEDIGAIPEIRVKPWTSLQAPVRAKADLRAAVCAAQAVLNSRA